MHITCVMVSSVNGKTTNGENSSIYHWSSKEDSDYFFKLIANNNLFIMGRKTYDTSKHLMRHTPGKLRMVLTTNPQQYSSDIIPNQLEFTNDSPTLLLEKLTQRGFATAYLLGGATVNTAFLKANLVNELWLTIEPKIFGTGSPLFAKDIFEKNLELVSTEKLNSQGTLLLKYRLL